MGSDAVVHVGLQATESAEQSPEGFVDSLLDAVSVGRTNCDRLNEAAAAKALVDHPVWGAGPSKKPVGLSFGAGPIVDAVWRGSLKGSGVGSGELGPPVNVHSGCNSVAAWQATLLRG